MFKKSSSRNQRSKGVKIKHGLQILLLLGICFWLIYQVKYSHDKKRELNEKDAKTAAKEESVRAVKFGRKDLHPLRDETATITNHVEDEEESREDIDEASTIDKEESREENDENKHNEEHDEETNKHEVGLGEEGNNHEHDEREDANDGVTDQEAARRHEEEEEREEEENRIDDPEVVREGGEDENDEPDEEKVQGEVDREEEFIDEEKEREEDNDERVTEGDDGEDKEGQAEDENVSEDEEHNESESESESGHSKHEAREENYKADDASSAVTHDTQTTLMDSEKLGLHDADDNSESSKTGQESNSTISDQINEGQDNLKSDMKENQVAEKAANSSEVVSQIKEHDDTKAGPANSSLLKPAITADPKDQEDAGVNSTEVNMGSINNLTMSGPVINGTENILDSPQAPNQTWVDAHASDGSYQQNIRVEMAKASTGNSSSSGSDSTSSIATTEVGNSSNFISNQTSTVKDENTSSDMKGEAENILKLPSMTKENDDRTHNETLDHRSEAGSSNTS